MADRSSWRVNLLLAAVSLVVMLGVVAVAGEIAVRYRERTRVTAPGVMPTLYYEHKRLRHALVRNFEYFGWVRIDSLGFRGDGFATTPAPGTIRLMVVGGSTTFDASVEGGDAAAWPSRLSWWLRRLAPEGPTVEVVNAGVPGYMVEDNLIRLQLELFRYRPDVILLYQTHNDLYDMLRYFERRGQSPDRPDAVDPATPWGRWLEANSLLYGKLAGRVRAVLFRGTDHTRQDPDRPARALAAGQERFARDVSLFLAAARDLGIPTVVAGVAQIADPDPAVPADSAAMAAWTATMPFATLELIRAGYASYTDTLRAVATRHGVPFLSTRDFGLAGSQWYAPGDPMHFSDAGAERMGEHMARALLGAGVLTARGASTDSARTP